MHACSKVLTCCASMFKGLIGCACMFKGFDWLYMHVQSTQVAVHVCSKKDHKLQDACVLFVMKC